MFPWEAAVYQLEPLRGNDSIVVSKPFLYFSPLFRTELGYDLALVRTDAGGRVEVGHIPTGREVVVAEDLSCRLIAVH